MIQKLILVACAVLSGSGAFVACTAANTSSPSANLPGVTTPLNQGSTAANVMNVNVGNCGTYTYMNEPCVSVKVCQPGTTNCTTIPNILLDTGSYGLRVFGSALGSTTLTQVTTGVSSLPVVECAQFGSGNTWGPVQTADVYLGGEAAVTVPIQVINSTYTVPSVNGSSECDSLLSSPSVGYNGILGVGLLVYDCGTDCVTHTYGLYFKCSSTSSCTDSVMPLNSQVVNPVAMLPTDNNGVILSLPTISLSGIISETGTLTLGIGTESNNAPGNLNVFQADNSANFTTVYGGTTDNESFIDSGSNALYFPDNSITQCSDAQGFYCPNSTLTLSAVQQSTSTSTAATIPFYIGNIDSLANSNNNVFNDIGGTGGALQFDWGLPFFLGRNIFVGFETKSSSLGTGPYWAY